MVMRKIEITWECKRCGEIFSFINTNSGKCPTCNFVVILIGIDIPDSVHQTPQPVNAPDKDAMSDFNIPGWKRHQSTDDAKDHSR